jgi:hypothetical protein
VLDSKTPEMAIADSHPSFTRSNTDAISCLGSRKELEFSHSFWPVEYRRLPRRVSPEFLSKFRHSML